MHSTNNKNVFIEVLEDCPVTIAEIPSEKDCEKTIARLQYEMIQNNPYKYTSDDVIFIIYAIRNGIPKTKCDETRASFFF